MLQAGTALACNLHYTIHPQERKVFVKRVTFTIFFCLGTVLVPFTLIHSLPIQNLYAPVSQLVGYQSKPLLPEYVVIFSLGVALIGLGRIGRKRFLKK